MAVWSTRRPGSWVRNTTDMSTQIGYSHREGVPGDKRRLSNHREAITVPRFQSSTVNPSREPLSWFNVPAPRRKSPRNPSDAKNAARSFVVPFAARPATPFRSNLNSCQRRIFIACQSHARQSHSRTGRSLFARPETHPGLRRFC